MQETYRRRLRILALSCLAAFLLVVFNGWMLSRAIQSFESRQNLVEHSYKILVELEQAISSLKDAESAQRAFIIAGVVGDLELYGNGRAQSIAHIQRARHLAPAGTGTERLIGRLESAIEKRIDALERTIVAFRTGNRKVQLEHMATGRALMNEVRTLVIEIEQTTQNELGDQLQQAAAQSRFVLLSLLASTTMNVGLIVALFAFMRRGMYHQEAETARRSREVELKTAEATASSLVAGDLTIQETATRIRSHIANRLNAPAVSVYLEKDGILQLVSNPLSSQAVSVQGAPTAEARFQPASYRIGEGLIGRVAISDTPAFMSTVPEDYFLKIRTSLGEAKPTNLIVMPLRFRRECVGVVEVASFSAWDDSVKEWIERISPPFAAALEEARARSNLQEILEQTQRQAEQLQIQQEELRATNEELEEQTKALIHSQEQLQVQTEELRQLNEELNHQTRLLERQQETLSLKNQALETGRRNLEEKAIELERANAYKSEFLAKMSHELRTPLNSLMILATLLRENKERNLTSQQIDFAKTIYDAGDDLLSLINDILDLSKLEARKLSARPEAFELKPFFEQLQGGFALQAESKGIRYEVQVDEGLEKTLYTDRQRLLQILRNLISNAFKFTPHGEVRVHASSSSKGPGYLRIEVTDTGIGIPEEKKRLIWEAFEQVDGSVSRKYGGTGLGLTISRELAFLLGGQISVESEPEKGSRFALEFPTHLEEAATGARSGKANASSPVEPRATSVSASSSISEAAPAAVPVAHGFTLTDVAKNEDSAASTSVSTQRSVPAEAEESTDRTLLIVEDEERFRDMLADLARASGFAPILASSAATAREILRTHSPQAILLDLGQNRSEGREFLAELQGDPRQKNVPIHVLARAGEVGAEGASLGVGPIDYLGRKPSIESVRSALDQIEGMIARRVKRLLIVEDDPNQRLAIQSLVGSSDTEVVTASTGQAALQEIRKGVDCVILDLNLPDMSGLELLERFAHGEATWLPPTVIYTGQELSKEEEDRLRRFSDSIIIKGGKSPERLLDEVNLFLRRLFTSAPARARSQFVHPSVSSSFEGRSLLIADDDLRNLFALTSALEGKGFRVTVARDGLEALDKLDSHPEIEAVLMDIMMPKLDGMEAMRRIRSQDRYKSLPMIALTAKTMKGDREKCIEAGADDFIAKPIDFQKLLSVLQVWLPTNEPPGEEASP